MDVTVRELRNHTTRVIGDGSATHPDGDARLSVATLTELHLGVLRAGSEDLRTVRERTLHPATRFVPLPYDEDVAGRLARPLTDAGAGRRGRRAGAMGCVVAATALVHGLTVWTRDGDCDVLAELDPDLAVQRAVAP